MKQFLLAILLSFPCITYADMPSTTDKTAASTVGWSSKNTDDTITIQNGTDLSLIVTINVSAGGGAIKVKNCGTTSVVQPGSTAICATEEADNPVNFAADNNDKPATGTYQVKQQ